MVSSNSTHGRALQRSQTLQALVLCDADAVSIAPLETTTRLLLRLRASSLWVLDPSNSIQLNIPINTCRETAGRTVVRLGPDEWWLLCPHTQSTALRQDLQSLLHGHFASVVDISDRQTTIAVAGIHAHDVINTGCPLDLRDANFPAGTATRTLLGKAEVVLMRRCSARHYHLEFLRSFATYIHTFLIDAACEFVPFRRSSREDT